MRVWAWLDKVEARGKQLCSNMVKVDDKHSGLDWHIEGGRQALGLSEHG